MELEGCPLPACRVQKQGRLWVATQTRQEGNMCGANTDWEARVKMWESPELRPQKVCPRAALPLRWLTSPPQEAFLHTPAVFRHLPLQISRVTGT